MLVHGHKPVRGRRSRLVVATATVALVAAILPTTSKHDPVRLPEVRIGGLVDAAGSAVASAAGAAVDAAGSAVASAAGAADRAIDGIAHLVDRAARGTVDAAESAGEHLLGALSPKPLGRPTSGGSGDKGPTSRLDPQPAAASGSEVDGHVAAAALPVNAINPAALVTVAGNGANSTVNGIGTAASFADMGGVVAVGNVVYVGTTGSIRKLDRATNAVTILAGDAAATGCTDSTVAAQVRFTNIRSLTSDGVYLYSVGDCGLRRTTIATGATGVFSSVPTPNYATWGNGYLYVTSGTAVYKVSNKGSKNNWATLPVAGHAIAYDTSNASLWVVVDAWDRQLRKIGSNGSVGDPIPNASTEIDLEGLAAANGALYLSAKAGTALRVYGQADGSFATIAGTGVAGHADGTATGAWTNGIKGIAFDGTRLWLAESGNHRLRTASVAAPLPAGLPASATTTLTIDPGTVTTVAGQTGGFGNVNGVGAAARLMDPGGFAVVGGYAYVGTGQLLRRVNLSTYEVSTFVGVEGTTSGSVDSLDPAAVRFGVVKSITTDGTYLYTIDADRVRRTALGVNGGGPAGATSTVTTLPWNYYTNIAFGPGGFLYVAGSEIARIDPSSGARSIVMATTSTFGLTADATHLWSVVPVTNGNALAKVDPATGTLAVVGGANAGRWGVVSAGSYVYNSMDTMVQRFSKADGAFVTIAGTATAGSLDGTGTEAWLNHVTGLGSDGTRVWAIDLTNSRGVIRRITPGQPLPSAQPATVNTTLAMATGAVTTHAGDGRNINVDGPAGSASFWSMDGIVTLNGFAYIGSMSSIRRVDLATGAVSTLAGHPTETGMVNSATASAVRFLYVHGLTTDGTYIYSLSSYGSGRLIRRTSIATGATTTVFSGNDSQTGMTFGPGPYVYTVQNYWPHSSAVHRIDLRTGVATNLFYTDSGAVNGITSDSQWLWVTEVAGSVTRISRMDPGTGAKVPLTTGVYSGYFEIGSIASAGDFLYTERGGSVRRTAKADGTTIEVAGAGAGDGGFTRLATGYADGTGTEAWFGGISGIVSDGTFVWVNDGTNRRLRRVAATDPLPATQLPTVDTTVAIQPAEVTTVAGNGTAADVDGIGKDASFRDLESVVVHDGYAYVGTLSSIRKVNLATRAVTTLAGHATETGFVDAPDPTAVRLYTTSSMATDGTYLFTMTLGMYSIPTIRRTHMTTGATSTLYSNYDLGHLTYGPGRYVYVVKNREWSNCCSWSTSSLLRVDASTGATTEVVPQTTDVNMYGLTSDGTWLYAVKRTWPSSVLRLERIDPSTGAGTVVVSGRDTPFLFNPVSKGQLASAGAYLYNAYGHAVVRVAKADGDADTIAGSDAAGYRDGIDKGAMFNNVWAVASDGASLWIADTSNRRLRKAVQAKLLTDPGGPTSRETLGGGVSPCDAFPVQGFDLLDPVNIATGNFYETYTDLSVPGRGPAVSFARTYSSLVSFVDSPVGFGWTHNYNMKLSDDPYRPGVKIVRLESGAEVAFTWNGSAWAPPSRVLSTLTANADGTFTFERRSCGKLRFDANGRLVSLTDRNGYSTTLGYDTSGRLSTVTDPASRVTTLAHNGSRISRVTDHTGRYVEFTYDPAGNLTDVSDVGRKNTHFEYDAHHLLLRIRDPRGKYTTTNTYDAGRRVLTQTDAVDRTSTISYDDAGVVTVTDPRGNVVRRSYSDGFLLSETQGYGTPQAATWSFGYDPVSLGRTTVTDPNNHTTSATYDAKGNLLTVTDGLQRTTTYTYNALSEPLTRTDARNVTTTWTYDTAGNRRSESTPLVGSGTTRSLAYRYDHPTRPGELTSVIDPNGETWSMAYDVFGNLVRSEDPLGNVTTHGYDALGRRTTTVTPKGNVAGGTPADYTTTATYNAFGDVLTLTDPNGRRTVRTLDDTRKLLTVEDAEHRRTTFTYDDAGQLTSVTRPDLTTVAYEYDGSGNLAVQRDAANRPTTYAYDALNRPTSMTDPLGRTSELGYDGRGNNTTITDQVDQVTTMTFDAADRLRAIGYSDPSTPDVVLDYDELGRRTSMTDGTGTTSYAWDSLSRLTSSTDGSGATVGYGWDLNSRNTSITYPGGGTVTRGHDDAGRLTSVTDWLTNTTTFGYDANSNPTARTLPNGTNRTDAFDRANRLTSIDHAVSGSSFASVGLQLNDVGIPTVVTPSGVPQSTETYTYSLRDQLQTVNGGTYSYDASDNITGLPSGAVLAYDLGNQLQSSTLSGQVTTFGHDGRGNRTSITPPAGPATTLAYDQPNRLVAYGGTATYSYNGDGLRMAKAVGGLERRFVWSSFGLPLLLKDGSDFYVYGPEGTPIERIGGDGSVVQVHGDHLGSVRALTDEAGAVVGTFAYDAYGNPTASTGTVRLPFGFAGEYRDDESGLVYLRARYLDPATGQFLTRDPITAVTKSPYGYTGGRPTAATDPTGLKTVGLCGGVSVNIWKIRFSGQACIVADTHGDVGVTTTRGGGGGTGAAPTASFQYTTADRVADLKGNNVSVGGSAPVGGRFSAGEDFGSGTDCRGERYYTGEFSVGKPSAPEVHGEATETAVLSTGPNSCAPEKTGMNTGVFDCDETMNSLPSQFIQRQGSSWPQVPFGPSSF